MGFRALDDLAHSLSTFTFQAKLKTMHVYMYAFLHVQRLEGSSQELGFFLLHCECQELNSSHETCSKYLYLLGHVPNLTWTF